MNFKSHKVYIYSTPVDMRRSYDGLHGLVRDQFDVLEGALFLFVSKDRTRAKCLFWDGSGLNLWMKRLERGRFADVFERAQFTLNELKLFFEGSKEVTRRLSPQDLSATFSS
jgi:transposase